MNDKKNTDIPKHNCPTKYPLNHKPISAWLLSGALRMEQHIQFMQLFRSGQTNAPF